MPNHVKRLTLSDDDRSSILDFMKQTRSKREYGRASAVLMKADGYSFDAVAERHGVSGRSVMRWIESYEADGLEGLRLKPHPGRPSRYRGKRRERIVQLALKSPALFGYLQQDWNLRLLARHLSKEVGIGIGKTRLSEILRDAGIVYKRPKAVVHSPDPDYPAKARRVEAYKQVASALQKRAP
jgi:transposase